MSLVKDAPTNFLGILKEIGPGLIISASIVGSGELIVTTKTGAENGFTLLWFIIFGCMIKVLVQVELGRYAVVEGKTSLEAINNLPGPKLIVSWLVWAWMVMFVATFFQLAGIVGGIAQVFQLGGLNLKDYALAAIITGSCALLLVVGRYRTVEGVSTGMVALFTLFTVAAVVALNWTDYAIGAENIVEGLSFNMPDSFVTAFAAFGVIGVGASELMYYPYWCLEKGYAARVGPREDSEAWRRRAAGWMKVLKVDAWVSMVIYTGATVAFYLLGAAVLHGKGLEVSNEGMVPNLSQLYSESFGEAGLWIFLLGAFVVLYSTVFIATASNGRLAADLFALLGLSKITSDQDRARAVRNACVALPALYFVFFVLFGQPVTLVTIGAVAQAFILPFLAFAAIYHLYKRIDRALFPSKPWVAALWISAALMAATGVYTLIGRISDWIKKLGWLPGG